MVEEGRKKDWEKGKVVELKNSRPRAYESKSIVWRGFLYENIVFRAWEFGADLNADFSE